ncbi:MAG: radical SAM family heme chaperone HemW [Bacteroidales bacterium]|nr:radical SAM family heme chaperone HemW [Bacteroidales bacterium]
MIYLHIPFCESFCTYCGFFSVCVPPALPVPEPVEGVEGFDAFADAVIAEIAARRDEIAATSAVNTLYIGGGTPSVLPLEVLSRIVTAIDWSPEGAEGEFTIEVNPEDIVEKGEEYVKGLMSLGVNRFSMGVQSFDDGILRWMNRRHDSARAIEAFRILRQCGAGNISLDLIFGLSQLDDSTWADTIDKTLALGPEHISAYQLSVEEDSALERMIQRGKYVEASDEQCRRQYDLLCEKLGAAGYRHYEISNFALPGREAIHNSAYWKRVPYVGLGPGAHSLSATSVRSWNAQEIPRRLRDGRLATYSREEEILTPEDIRIERIMLPLRTDIGMPEEELRSLAGDEPVDRLLSENALVRFSRPLRSLSPSKGTNRYIRIPESRFFVSDEIIRELI